MGDGVGAAVRAAISAGDSIREPATHAPIPAVATDASTAYRMLIRAIATIPALLPTTIENRLSLREQRGNDYVESVL
jgi:hypothetical protein